MGVLRVRRRHGCPATIVPNQATMLWWSLPVRSRCGSAVWGARRSLALGRSQAEPGNEGKFNRYTAETIWQTGIPQLRLRTTPIAEMIPAQPPTRRTQPRTGEACGCELSTKRAMPARTAMVPNNT